MAAVTPVSANKCVGAYADSTPNIQLYCEKPDGTYTCATWRKFRVSCPKVNGQCSSLSEAWVPAVTVCNQRLF